jgi:predicted nucleic-acid-binding Zn-ribbon protein
MKKEAVIVCPKCGSTDVIPHKKGKHTIAHGEAFEATWTRKVCEKCGYYGSFFPEVPKKILKKIQREIKRESKK